MNVRACQQDDESLWIERIYIKQIMFPCYERNFTSHMMVYDWCL